MKKKQKLNKIALNYDETSFFQQQQNVTSISAVTKTKQQQTKKKY